MSLYIRKCSFFSSNFLPQNIEECDSLSWQFICKQSLQYLCNSDCIFPILHFYMLVRKSKTKNRVKSGIYVQHNHKSCLSGRRSEKYFSNTVAICFNLFDENQYYVSKFLLLQKNLSFKDWYIKCHIYSFQCPSTRYFAFCCVRFKSRNQRKLAKNI